MIRSKLLVLLVFALAVPGIALAQEMFVYPQNGQDAEQQKMDEFQCYNWAKDQSGFDPMAPPTASRPPPQKGKKKGGAGRGALGGAALGAGIGVLRGDTAKWATRGAATGALVGGVRSSNQRKSEAASQQNWEQEQVGQYTAARNGYNRAYAACLTGRGYSVQ